MALNGNVSWGIVPIGYTNSNLQTMSAINVSNFMKSANDQVRYQVQWFSGSLNEAQEATLEGDVVSVIFKVEKYRDADWVEIGRINKSRDIANRRYNNDTPPVGHRFTVDIGQLISDDLSYSLCPINKGTWNSYEWGGMNGGLLVQDNVIGKNSPSGFPVSDYNVTQNGTFARIRVTATFNVLNSELEVVTDSYVLKDTPDVVYINSVNQFEKDSTYYYNNFLHNGRPVTVGSPRRFNTRCPNWYWDYSENKVEYHKAVRMDEQAEFLQWYISSNFPVNDANQTTEKFDQLEIFGTAFDDDGTQTDFVMVDFQQLINPSNYDAGVPKAIWTATGRSQNRMVIQNVSPDYINNNAKVPVVGLPPYTTSISPLTSTTKKYSLHFRGRYFSEDQSAYVVYKLSASNWYEIDRENENIPFGFVRFHWLNSMGGIDSYTAKRDVVEGLTVDRDVVDRKSSDRTWYQANKTRSNGNAFTIANETYISDTMRGGNIYKGGREVMNVNAERVQSVYTEPLNKSVAKWLEEMILSPNVWTEMDNEATARGNQSAPYLRPSTKEYIPIIITNNDVETVNESQGLVTFNIEYTLSHKVQTQRN